MADKDMAFRDLRVFKRFCDTHKITFWLDWGTLLGAVRDGKFIPWEQDIDLGFHKEELDKVLTYKDFLKKIGFNMFKKPDGYALVHKGLTSKMDLGCYVIRDGFAYQTCDEYNKIGEMCDLLLFVLNLEDANFKYETIVPANILALVVKASSFVPLRKQMIMIVERVMKKAGINKSITLKSKKEFFELFDKILFYDEEFNAPHNVKEYLQSLYGDDWMVPINWIENESINKWNEFRNIESG